MALYHRPADEIEAGDVIEYQPGARMLVTVPGPVRSHRFGGRRVGHHGVVLTVCGDDAGGGREAGEPMSTLHTPRQKVPVLERRAFGPGDRCPCAYHRGRRGESGPAVLPPPAAEPQEDGGAPGPSAPGAAALPGAGAAAVAGAEGAAPGCALARAVAPLLGDGWSAQGPRYEGEDAGYVVHADGKRLRIGPDERPSFRETHVEVSVVYPDKVPVQIPPAHYPVTRFRWDRPAGALAAAITAKLLPVYGPRYQQYAAQAAERCGREEAARSYAEGIAVMVPSAQVSPYDCTRVVARPIPSHIERMTADVGVDGSCRLRFDYVPREVLEVLVRAYGATVHERGRQAGRGADAAVR